MALEKGTITIDYAPDLGGWYVFEHDGREKFVKSDFGWYGDTVATGKSLGTYSTLKAAKEAHPTAILTKNSQEAVSFGCE